MHILINVSSVNLPMKLKRRLIKIHRSYYVTIPPDYVRLMKLEKRDEFEIELVSDGSLRFKPVELGSKKEGTN